MEPGDPGTDEALGRGERASDERFAVRLHDERSDPVVDFGAWNKTGVEAAIGIESCDSPETHAGDRPKGTYDDHPAIRLHGHCNSMAVRPGSQIETVVKAPIRVEP